MSISITTSLIVDYERSLAGLTKRIPNYYFQGKQRFKQKNVITVVRYAFKNILGLTGPEALIMVNRQLLKDLGLLNLMKYVEFPYGLPKSSYFYLIFLAFPEDFGDKDDKLLIYMYKKVLSGEASFPVHFFDGEEGKIAATTCFSYITSFLSMSSFDEYAFFASAEGKRFLRENKLSKAIGICYRTPLDFYHESLPEKRKNYFFYEYFKYKQNFKNVRKAFTFKGDRNAKKI